MSVEKELYVVQRSKNVKGTIVYEDFVKLASNGSVTFVKDLIKATKLTALDGSDILEDMESTGRLVKITSLLKGKH